ncbi:MAG TPA: hypothetical protein PKD18_08530 [Saprospiraceae bacterium]|nr:hypothetical protein [Saprospiraceae bacterium]
MTKEFEIEIGELYKTFAKYPFKPSIEGCPCCVSDTDKSTLHSKQLRELEDEDISRYAFKAITTWGDVNDFKHYLLRIFELSSTRKLIVDSFVVLGKLDHGNWTEWENQEILTITKFLKSWWKYEINYNGYFDSEILIEINKIIKDLPTMLSDWNLSMETQGFRNYVELTENHYYELRGKNKTFKELSEQEVETLINWIECNSFRLEEGFFKFESIDKKFSDRLSNTLYIFERTE